MQLYILGKNTDDKGVQLEQLTERLLCSQGLENIQLNIIGSGGNEVDVTAYHKVTIGMKQQTVKVIAECKAHQTPIDISDWFKFKGKLGGEQKKNPHAIGIMVCLSGAKGTVVGDYNENHQNDEQLQLIANADLRGWLSCSFDLPSEQIIRKRLAGISFSEIDSINLVYYHKQIYWVVSFLDGRYTLSQTDGRPVEKEEVVDVLQIIDIYSPYSKTAFVDIQDLEKVQSYLTSINIVLLTALANGYKGDVNEVAKHIIDISSSEGVNVEILKMAIRNNPFVEFQNDSKEVYLKHKDAIDIVEFYIAVICNGCPVELLTSDFYQQNINETLLSRISKIQFGFEIPEEKKSDVLFLLKHSPSAMLYAITPDNMLRGYSATKHQEKMKALYEMTFMRRLINGFVENFQRQQLSSTYLNAFDISEIKVKSDIIITHNKEERSFNTHSRLVLAKLEENANNVILVESVLE